MLAGATIGSEARIKIVVQTPGQVVSIQTVFLNAERRALVGVVAQALRGEHHFIEILAVSIAGVDAQKARQKPDTVAVIDGAAVLVEAAAEGAKPIAGLEGIDDVVIAHVVAAWRAGRFLGGRHGWLGECGSEHAQGYY